MKHVIFGIILGLAATAALATQSNDGTICNGNGSCGTTNNYNTTNAPVANGGAGGAGGSATLIDNSKTTNTNTNLNTNVTSSKADAQAKAAAAAAAMSGSVSGAKATGGQGIGSVVVEGEKQVRQAPGLGVAATQTTAGCMVAVYGGVSVPGVAVSAGTAIKDKPCDKRARGLALVDVARVAQQLGSPAEFYAPIFVEGLELIRESASDEEGTTKNVGEPAAAETAPLNP